MCKYPDIKVTLTNIDGNAFSIIGAVAKGLKEAGVPHREVLAYRKEAMAGSYDGVIQTSMNWVDVT